jgi:Domain of unknown function (DUF4286)
MAAGKMIVMTNPASPESEKEFNRWYDEIHLPDVVALPGFKSATRFRARIQVLPPSEKPAFDYLAIYELEDVDQALASLEKFGPELELTDAIDMVNVMEVLYDPISSVEK